MMENQMDCAAWIELFDHEENLLARQRVVNTGILPVAGDTFRITAEGGATGDPDATYQVVRREFVIDGASVTARIYGRDLRLGGTA